MSNTVPGGWPSGKLLSYTINKLPHTERGGGGGIIELTQFSSHAGSLCKSWHLLVPSRGQLTCGSYIGAKSGSALFVQQEGNESNLKC